MTILDIAYINFEHGGLQGDRDELALGAGGCTYDHTGLVRVAGEDGRWPDILVMGEADRYEYWGGRGAWEAINCMAAAGGPRYAWLPCVLPREWGPFAPVIFYNPQMVAVQRYFSPHAPDFAARTRNLLIVEPAAGGEQVRLIPVHGAPWSWVHRSTDAEELRFLADRRKNTIILGDFNEPLSGPGFEPTDLSVSDPYPHPGSLASKVQLHNNRIEFPARRSTGSLDFLCGWWDYDRGQRVNGAGFHDVCEMAGIQAPTDMHKPISDPGPGRQGVALDHILVNDPLKDRVVIESVRVHEPIDPEAPDTDHKRLSVQIKL
jgi:endonuclease/exonuclease/phosphatase family metal-dependent hydrolase